MLAVVLLASCHSKKDVTANAKEELDVESKVTCATATTSRVQWHNNFALDIDSFELVIPWYQFPDTGKMVSDAPAGLPSQETAVLRGARARINRNDVLQRDEHRNELVIDTMAAHRTSEETIQTHVDEKAVTKPPDTAGWLKLLWLLLAAPAIYAASWLINKVKVKDKE